MDTLVNWGLTANEEDICGNCGMHKDESTGCCKDEHKQIKLEGEQKVPKIFSSVFNFPIDLPLLPGAHYTIASHSSVAIAFPVSHAPPDKAPIPIYLYNCLFRI